MKKILVTGVSVIDFIFQIDEIPKHFEKYRAKDASISGGGVKIDSQKVINPDLVLDSKKDLEGKILQIGKKIIKRFEN